MTFNLCLILNYDNYHICKTISSEAKYQPSIVKTLLKMNVICYL